MFEPICGVPNGVGYLYLEYKKQNPSLSGNDIWKIICLKNDIKKILDESKIPENS